MIKLISTLVFIDGEVYPKEHAKISVYDHGLLYGDGIYEGMRCYSGYVFQMNEHLERLMKSAKSLRMEIPYNKQEIGEFVLETLRKNRLNNAYIRLLVTRGNGAIGPDPRSCKRPSFIIIVEDLPNVHGTDALTKGISMAIVSIHRDAIDATSHEIKSLNYLNSIQGKMEAIQYNADDAIFLDSRGFISESPICNIFIYSNGEIATPHSGNGILLGITRQNVIEIAKEMGLSVVQRDITPYELINADEVFITGTHAEIVGVTKVNNIEIGSGCVGEITKQIMSRFRERTLNPKFGTPIEKQFV